MLEQTFLIMVNLFDVNNRCTWSLACACVNCRISRNILCLKLPVQFESAVRRLFELSPATHDFLLHGVEHSVAILSLVLVRETDDRQLSVFLFYVYKSQNL